MAALAAQHSGCHHLLRQLASGRAGGVPEKRGGADEGSVGVCDLLLDRQSGQTAADEEVRNVQ